jgi:chemotaxis protein methyltransferase CheR
VTAPFDKIADARSLAQAIVDTVREPLLVLDADLNILLASGSFYRSFQMSPEHAQGRSLFALDGGAWNIPALRTLLNLVATEDSVMEGFEVVHEFPRIGARALLLHARRAIDGDASRTLILLGFEDVTERRAIEREKALLQEQTGDLVLQKEMLLEEMQHRVLNSLQIIASILMLKARAVTSEEARQHLQDAHQRVMSVAAVQQHLHSTARGELIEMAPYLSKLCDSLAKSMIGDDRQEALHVVADKGFVASADAVSIGLIVTELVINALKHAFSDGAAPGVVIVRYEANGTDWKISVSDNGAGKAGGIATDAKGGLGTSLVNALAHQLDAQVSATSGPDGMTVSIAHATFTSRSPLAA